MLRNIASLAGLLVVGLAAGFASPPAHAADAAASAAAKSTYLKERADCEAGRTAQDRATCLKEAGAAEDERKRNRLDDAVADQLLGNPRQRDQGEDDDDRDHDHQLEQRKAARAAGRGAFASAGGRPRDRGGGRDFGTHRNGARNGRFGRPWILARRRPQTMRTSAARWRGPVLRRAHDSGP